MRENHLRQRLWALASVFLKLGIVGFGGPAAHIALMETEIVEKRQWLSREKFLDLLGATNLIPGPNSTEMAIHIGYLYSGLWGLILAGSCFILPAITLTAILAFIYTQYGSLPQIEFLLYGIKPAVIAIVFGALYRLGKKAIKKRKFWLIIVIVIIFLLTGLNQVLCLLLGGFLGMLWLMFTDNKPSILGIFTVLVSSNLEKIPSKSIIEPSLWQLGLFFLKIGSVLFGSGYVLIAFLEWELVNKYGWLTQQQLLDAIAIGQFTPGPVLSTATFIGYVILGFPGAIISTLGIFLPSFLFVLVVNPIIPKLRQSKLAGAFLDAINVSAVALMAMVTLNLLYQTLWIARNGLPFDGVALLIVVVASVAIFRYKVDAPWVVVGGGVFGSLLQQFLT